VAARARVSGPIVSRRTFGTGLAAAALLPARRALAQGYPGNQTIKLMVPYPAGGATDVIGRMVAAAEVTKPSAAATRATVHEHV
jgi:tripartite-type tricarboxylate transporter receptor subunit TctC